MSVNKFFPINLQNANNITGTYENVSLLVNANEETKGNTYLKNLAINCDMSGIRVLNVNGDTNLKGRTDVEGTLYVNGTQITGSGGGGGSQDLASVLSYGSQASTYIDMSYNNIERVNNLECNLLNGNTPITQIPNLYQILQTTGGKSNTSIDMSLNDISGCGNILINGKLTSILDYDDYNKIFKIEGYIPIYKYAMNILSSNAYGAISIGENAFNVKNVNGIAREVISIGNSSNYNLTTGSNNIGIGKLSNAGITSGSYNIGIGEYTLGDMTGISSNNICIGKEAGTSYGAFIESNNSIYIGSKCGVIGNYNIINNSIAIGNDIKLDLSNIIIIGSASQKVKINGSLKTSEGIDLSNTNIINVSNITSSSVDCSNITLYSINGVPYTGGGGGGSQDLASVLSYGNKASTFIDMSDNNIYNVKNIGITTINNYTPAYNNVNNNFSASQWFSAGLTVNSNQNLAMLSGSGIINQIQTAGYTNVLKASRMLALNMQGDIDMSYNSIKSNIKNCNSLTSSSVDCSNLTLSSINGVNSSINMSNTDLSACGNIIISQNKTLSYLANLNITALEGGDITATGSTGIVLNNFGLNSARGLSLINGSSLTFGGSSCSINYNSATLTNIGNSKYSGSCDMSDNDIYNVKNLNTKAIYNIGTNPLSIYSSNGIQVNGELAMNWNDITNVNKIVVSSDGTDNLIDLNNGNITQCNNISTSTINTYTPAYQNATNTFTQTQTFNGLVDFTKGVKNPVIDINYTANNQIFYWSSSYSAPSIGGCTINLRNNYFFTEYYLPDPALCPNASIYVYSFGNNNRRLLYSEGYVAGTKGRIYGTYGAPGAGSNFVYCLNGVAMNLLSNGNDWLVNLLPIYKSYFNLTNTSAQILDASTNWQYLRFTGGGGTGSGTFPAALPDRYLFNPVEASTGALNTTNPNQITNLTGTLQRTFLTATIIVAATSTIQSFQMRYTFGGTQAELMHCVTGVASGNDTGIRSYNIQGVNTGASAATRLEILTAYPLTISDVRWTWSRLQ